MADGVAESSPAAHYRSLDGGNPSEGVQRILTPNVQLAAFAHLYFRHAPACEHPRPVPSSKLPDGRPLIDLLLPCRPWTRTKST